MKKLVFLVLFACCFASSFGAHIKGGFLTYEWIGAGIADPTANRYNITLTVYMSCYPSEGQLTNSVALTIFQGNQSDPFQTPTALRNFRTELIKAMDDPCITGNQDVCYYTIAKYQLTNYELPASPLGYTISYQRCCRINNMENLVNSGDVGTSYTIKIPGTSHPVPNAVQNSSPDFPLNDSIVVCSGNYFSYPFTATDVNGDDLTYTLCSAYLGGSTQITEPVPAGRPPYDIVDYATPYSGRLPMGPGVMIDRLTGLISGIAPVLPTFSNGEFVITVCVSESRNGVLIGETRKELHIQVKDCVPEQAQLAPKAVTCDGFAVDFSNAVPLRTGTIYTWNFGDPISGASNTSSQTTPSHSYTDTGVYNVTLQVSIGGFCQSKDSLLVRVYPGFFPSFDAVAPLCKGEQIKFEDKTTSRYGSPTGWRWKFQDPDATIDTSGDKTPTHTFAKPGTYDVQLIVGNTFGCVDTIVKPVVIADNPVLTLGFRDTAYCALDTLQLSANGTGNFSWAPSGNIRNANTANPLVFPEAATVYRVSLNQGGCISRDSVFVNPKNDLTTSITASALSICEDDTLTLTANSNYTNNISWQWQPASAVFDAQAGSTLAYPATTTDFRVTTTFGRNCKAVASQRITVKPIAKPNAGPDTYVCIGQTNTQLAASGGDTYQWSPATGLSNPNIRNPVAAPSTTTTYKVAVGVSGCTRLKSDSVQVLVRDLPLVSLTNDTLICTIDTLQLHAAGSGSFTWSPAVNINNVNSPDPLVSPDLPITYFATLSDAFGCTNRDSVFVNVKSFVTLNAGNDTTICRTDAIILNAQSDGLSFRWTPSLYLSSDTAKNPLSTPLDASITYTVVGNIGKCQSEDEVTIRTVPYPQVSINADTLICFGDSAPLNAGGGDVYTWTPASFLTAATIPNPVAVKPTTDTRYTVSVKGNAGCPKPVEASVWVRVYPIVRANAGPPDTSIVLGQPLALTASGADSYVWSPGTWLNNPNIANPVGMPEDNILYTLKATSIAGCSGMDTISVRVFKVPPSFYVPTGFSPNNDSRNDVIKPIMLGMRSINYFRVFNRWGQVIYATSQQGQGWDGTFKGSPQDPGTYVWMAEGVTFTGQVIKKQGTVLLLR